MVMGKCVMAFMALLLASMVMQFFRARKRKSVVQRFDESLLSGQDQEKWRAVSGSLDFVFKDFRKLQIIKRNLSQLPEDLVNELGRYSLFSKFEILVTATMFLFGVFAYRFCN
jgi:hypothetical protein